MLARTFLPAANLKITDKQHDALVATLLLLESGKVKHRAISDSGPGGPGFNMHAWNCGTCACIGGWADTFGAGFDDDLVLPPNINRLFFPSIYVFDVRRKKSLQMWRITVEQGAKALRNFLERGKPDWAAVLGHDRYIEV